MIKIKTVQTYIFEGIDELLRNEERNILVKIYSSYSNDAELSIGIYRGKSSEYVNFIVDKHGDIYVNDRSWFTSETRKALEATSELYVKGQYWFREDASRIEKFINLILQ